MLNGIHVVHVFCIKGSIEGGNRLKFTAFSFLSPTLGVCSSKFNRGDTVFHCLLLVCHCLQSKAENALQLYAICTHATVSAHTRSYSVAWAVRGRPVFVVGNPSLHTYAAMGKQQHGMHVYSGFPTFWLCQIRCFFQNILTLFPMKIWKNYGKFLEKKYIFHDCDVNSKHFFF